MCGGLATENPADDAIQKICESVSKIEKTYTFTLLPEICPVRSVCRFDVDVTSFYIR